MGGEICGECGERPEESEIASETGLAGGSDLGVRVGYQNGPERAFAKIGKTAITPMKD